jgi:S1-C subfamily serine protease
VGDIVTAWNGSPIDRVREIMRLLGPDSIGSSVGLEVLRAGAKTSVKVTVGERALR